MKTRDESAGRRRREYVLITGGCGFIGSNLANALAARGEQVTTLDSMLRPGSAENACWLKTCWRDRIEVVTGDVRDEQTVRTLVTGASAVLHLAAQVAVTTSLEQPLEDLSINAVGTLNVLESVRQHNPTAPVIFASTNKVYGKILHRDELARRGVRYAPRHTRVAKGIGEDTPLDLYSPYGCSKGAADQYVRDYSRVFGLRTAVLRMSCIYGPRQFGTEDQGWLAHFLLSALREEPITIYGDGYQVRDALFIDDAMSAWLRALDLIDTIKGSIFNLGGGPQNAVSLLEAIELITSLRGTSPALRFADWRPGDQAWYVSDIGAIRAALDWSPRTPVKEGLIQLHRWLCSRFSPVPAMVLQEIGA
jgi:CDP-paratose 2-epimerase